MAFVSAAARIRDAGSADVPSLCTVLDSIIAIGGLTAFERPLGETAFQAYFMDGPRSLACLVAEDAGGAVLGFQALTEYPGLPQGWADIATFTSIKPKTPGVGTALFAVMAVRAKALGLTAINAAIRSDNDGALVYYARMGFETYDRILSPDGVGVDRVLKRYLVGA